MKHLFSTTCFALRIEMTLSAASSHGGHRGCAALAQNHRILVLLRFVLLSLAAALQSGCSSSYQVLLYEDGRPEFSQVCIDPAETAVGVAVVDSLSHRGFEISADTTALLCELRAEMSVEQRHFFGYYSTHFLLQVFHLDTRIGSTRFTGRTVCLTNCANYLIERAVVAVDSLKSIY